MSQRQQERSPRVGLGPRAEQRGQGARPLPVSPSAPRARTTAITTPRSESRSAKSSRAPRCADREAHRGRVPRRRARWAADLRSCRSAAGRLGRRPAHRARWPRLSRTSGTLSSKCSEQGSTAASVCEAPSAAAAAARTSASESPSARPRAGVAFGAGATASASAAESLSRLSEPDSQGTTRSVTFGVSSRSSSSSAELATCASTSSSARKSRRRAAARGSSDRRHDGRLARSRVGRAEVTLRPAHGARPNRGACLSKTRRQKREQDPASEELCLLAKHARHGLSSLGAARVKSTSAARRRARGMRFAMRGAAAASAGRKRPGCTA